MKVGSLVGYVKHNPKDDNLIRPDKNAVYTVRAFFKKGTVIKHPGCGLLVADDDGIYLEEIVNPKEYFKLAKVFYENSYYASSFRELQPPIANIEEHINQNTLEYEERV